MKTLKRWCFGAARYPWVAVSVMAAAVLAGVLMPSFTSIHASSISNGGGGGGGAAGANVVTTFSATPTFTCPSATQGSVVNFQFNTSLTANVTSSTLANCTPGSLLNFIFTQDATGGRTVNMPGAFVNPATVHPAPFISTKCTYFFGSFGNIFLTGGGCVSDAGYGFGQENAAPANPPANTCFSWFDATLAVPHWNCNSVVFTSVFPMSRVPNQFVTALGAGGALATAAIAQADLPATSTQTIASGQTAMPTAAVAGNACSAAATTAAATGALNTDALMVTFASDPTGVVGYGGGLNGGITINAWPTANQINFKLCNQTANSITPGAININWRDVR